MGRLPLHRVPRRRRDRARQPQRAAAHPVLPRAGRSAAAQPARARAWSTARSSSPTEHGLDFDALQLRIHPPESGSKLARRDPGAASWPSTCSPSATTTCVQHPFGGRGASASSARCAGAAPPRPPHPGHRATATIAADWFERFEGAGLDGVIAKPLDGAVRARTSAPWSRSSTSARPTAWSPGSACTRTATASGRCCSACTTTTGDAAPRRRGHAASRRPLRRELVDGAGSRTGRTRSTATRGGSGPTPQATARRGRPDAGRAEPLERQEGPVAGSRCGSSWSPRSPTSSSRATASATRPGSSAGGPTGTPRSCTYDQLEAPVPHELAEIFGL